MAQFEQGNGKVAVICRQPITVPNPAPDLQRLFQFPLRRLYIMRLCQPEPQERRKGVGFAEFIPDGKQTLKVSKDL